MEADLSSRQWREKSGIENVALSGQSGMAIRWYPHRSYGALCCLYRHCSTNYLEEASKL